MISLFCVVNLLLNNREYILQRSHAMEEYIYVPKI